MRRTRPIQLAITLSALLLPSLAWAATRPAEAPAPPSDLKERILAELPGCDCAEQDALFAARDRIADAADLEAAKSLALEDVTMARRALGAARRLAPFSKDLADAHERIASYAQEVEQAESVDAVVLRFEDFVQVASADEIIGVDGDYDGGDHGSRMGCSFSTGELIAIVLGFILGIIPGIILLILLC